MPVTLNKPIEPRKKHCLAQRRWTRHDRLIESSSLCFPGPSSQQALLSNVYLGRCIDSGVIDQILQSELDEVDFTVAEDTGEPNSSIRTHTFGAGFKLVQVLTGNVEACSKLRQRLLIRFAESGKKLGKRERPTI
jgi:hypothetical protein